MWLCMQSQPTCPLSYLPLSHRADKGPAFGGSRGFGGSASSAAAKKPADEGPGVAQQRFGNAKSISSAAFHGEIGLVRVACGGACVQSAGASALATWLCDWRLHLRSADVSCGTLRQRFTGPQLLHCMGACRAGRCRAAHADPIFWSVPWCPAGRDNAESEYEKQQRLSQFQVRAACTQGCTQYSVGAACKWAAQLRRCSGGRMQGTAAALLIAVMHGHADWPLPPIACPCNPAALPFNHLSPCRAPPPFPRTPTLGGSSAAAAAPRAATWT